VEEDKVIEKEVSVSMFIKAIKPLASDSPVENARVWYRTQKEHWLGWLNEYEGPGAYGRKTGIRRDAKSVYNHVVCPELLMYLIRAIPLHPELVKAAEKAYLTGSSKMEKSGAIRKVVAWKEIYKALWGAERPSMLERLLHLG
jgi:deoxyribodipyrimidine photolyase-like uncharacterized protein